MKKWTRPNGLIADKYRRLEAASARRLAWEFLRRNSQFQTNCRRAGANKERQRRVAADFGLKPFKRFDQIGGRPPRFLSATPVRVISNSRKRKAEHNVRLYY